LEPVRVGSLDFAVARTKLRKVIFSALGAQAGGLDLRSWRVKV
jgi:hypothetical protein